MSIVLLIATCGATGLAIRLLRRWPRLVFIATSIGSSILFLLLATAPSSPISFLGRSLTLDFAERIFLWPAIGVAAALAFFGPLTFEWVEETPARVISNSQGAFFFWSLAPLIVAMAIDSFPLAAFFWAIGLILLVLVAQPLREGRVGGAAQFLLLTVIATASLLLSNRFFDLYPLTPENLDLVRSAFLFLAWGLGLMLAVVPLHIWMGPLADEMPLLGMAFLVGVAQPVGLLLLFQLMNRMLWLTEKSSLLNTLLLAGAVTIPVGALFAIAESRKGRLLAYLSLVSLGQALIGFGLGTQVGLAAAMLAVLNRAIGIALVAGGMVFVSYHEERRWQAVGALAILAGGLAIAGIPPAVGVASRWGIYASLASVHPLLVGLLFASSAAVLLAVMRFVHPVLNGLSQAVESTGEVKVVPYLCAAVVVILVAIVVIAGIFPQLLSNPLIAALGNADYLK
jgi:formate hydrogenlyase subunit 3/multisubunit Na+/H+ antiporter MnhD subunit